MRTTNGAATSTVEQRTEGAVRPANPSIARHRPDVRRGWPFWIWLAVRGLGALSVLAVGAVHLQQYLWLYSAIPTIGTLFVLTFVGATLIGLMLLVPIERWARRWGPPVLVVVTVGGIVLAAVTFALLLVSESTPLFGFQEPGYDPTAITASQASEVAAVVFLGASLVLFYLTHMKRQPPLVNERAHSDKELSA